ncbi:hypothetical protein PSN45_005278 [Yamadazyma tenuis]|uniref:Uncharacterized protein n=1 Tax=Candida tenuis (strain ATCC 10573 / BCRC 21748 / CBS 615 / JCM 9827 / NBRC 10315 / NRRL Y-1498 / VKM Y-70) TaxID=590646 RepID=G3B1A6_CANTC|nr:uncharacterized protein CANTEDRAFT_134229 [Yamadazyma tenuis ATCC 10573]EGV64924.1 hypothetical protein CANTEDRAFT_134229 [Yamadazyma tenuis ATCC 10573]WEJ97719.1 hypothetical protein PSN45_005278 [Yamadazyma tenuis]
MKYAPFFKYLAAVLFFTNSVLVLLVWNFPASSPSQPMTQSSSDVGAFENYQQHPIDLANASAIVNAVQGALRQKSSNIQPVGVTFIPAYIPPNTRLYHSRGDGNIPKSFEWVAFDYEFSYNFAGFSRRINSTDSHRDRRNGPAHLLTFKNTKAFDKVIFLDGASAAKIVPEMDQQLILSNGTQELGWFNERIAADKICKWGKKFGLHGFIRLEIGYEMVLCDFHKDLKLISNITLPYANDMLGFPADDPQYLPSPPDWAPPGGNDPGDGPGGPGGPGGPPKSEENQSPFYLQERNLGVQEVVDYSSSSFNRSLLLSHISSAVGFEHVQISGYSDLLEERVLLDFSNMVTPLNKTYINPDPYARNISYISQEIKNSIIYDLERIYQQPTDPSRKTNWQAIINLMQFKFGPLLVNLNSTLYEEDIKVLSDNIQILAFNLIRSHTDNNWKTEQEQRQHAIKSLVDSYVYHSYPLVNYDSNIYSALFKVHNEILTLIFDIFEASKRYTKQLYVDESIPTYKDELDTLRSRTSKLMELLNWAVFYQCSRKCNSNEMCFTPTWGPGPFGGMFERSDEMFDHDGDIYRIKHELKCVSYKLAAETLPPLN